MPAHECRKRQRPSPFIKMRDAERARRYSVAAPALFAPPFLFARPPRPSVDFPLPSPSAAWLVDTPAAH